jgi:hypothetical protein
MGTMPAMKSSFAVRTCEACGARFMVQSQEPLDQTSEILCPECTQIFRGHAVNSDPEATSNSLFNENNQTQYEDAMNFIDENGREISDFEGDEFELLAGEGSGLDSFDDSDLELDEGDEGDEGDEDDADGEGEGYDDDDYDDDDDDDDDFFDDDDNDDDDDDGIDDADDADDADDDEDETPY